MSLSVKAVILLVFALLVSLQLYANKMVDRQTLHRYIKKEQIEQRHVHLIKRFFEAQNRHKNPRYFEQFFTRNLKIQDIVSSPDFLHNKKTALRKISFLQHRYPGYNIETKEMVADPNEVIVRYRVLTRKQKLLSEMVSIFHFQKGKISHIVDVRVPFYRNYMV